MNITKKVKTNPEKIFQTKPSFLIISTNYQLETLYHILIKNPSLVNSKDQKGETFLSYAIKRKNTEIAELIITSPKLDYNYQDINGNSYLHLSVINKLENISKTLIEKGINVNLQNNEGNTALHFAYSTGDSKLITLIIETKADFTIKNKNGLIGEEIKEGTFSEIIYDTNNNSNKKCIDDLNISNNNNISKEINNNSDKELTNINNISNDIIINEKAQINKSIKLDWDNKNINNEDMKNESKINNDNISNNSNIVNQSGSQQNSKLKFSLVNFSYSEEEGENEEQKINQEKQKISEIKNSMQSSDIFDLCSSATYQEKLATMNNYHKVDEPKIITKKNSSDSNTNDDIVNVNISKIQINQSNSINVNNIIQNGLQLSQNSLQTSYENGRNNIIINQNQNGNGLNKYGEKNRNGGKIIMDFCKSLTKEDMVQNNIKYDKKYSESISFNDINNNNIKKSNIIQSQVENTDNFVFSPFASLKKPLNNQLNGSEINIDNYNNINPNNLSNININKEIKKLEKQKPKEYKTINTSSPDVFKYNPIKESNIEIISQKSQSIKGLNSNIIDKNNRISQKNNTNLSETNLNNFSSKTNGKINLDCPINSSDETSISSQMIKSNDPLYKFLLEIRLEKYYSLMKSNGFDDIQLLINQTKNGIGITDKQLKLSGINIPGDRAKILIRLQEKAGNFNFQIPKEVYYICQKENYDDDKYINKLRNWLEELKIENYLDNFIKNGYYSLELMILQMESKNPINDEILKEEIGIDKIGHRSRIINKLNEDAKNSYNKWKNSLLIMGGDLTKKICDCNIF